MKLITFTSSLRIHEQQKPYRISSSASRSRAKRQVEHLNMSKDMFGWEGELTLQ